MRELVILMALFLIIVGIFAGLEKDLSTYEQRIQQLETNYIELLTQYNDLSQTQIVLLELYETQEVRN